MFGDFDVVRMEASRTGSAIFLIVLLLIVQIALLNLLIAMFTETYSKVMASAQIEWQYDFFLLIDFFELTATSTPPPLNLVAMPFRLVRRWSNGTVAPAGRLSGAGAFHDQPAGAGDQQHQDELRAFNAYSRSRDVEKDKDVGVRVEVAHERIKALEVRHFEDRDNVDTRFAAIDHKLKALESQLGALARYVTVVPQSSLRALDNEDVRRRAWLLHVKSRSEENAAYAGKRSKVPDSRVPWEVPWPDYEPPDWTADVVLRQPPWADRPDAAMVREGPGHTPGKRATFIPMPALLCGAGGLYETPQLRADDRLLACRAPAQSTGEDGSRRPRAPGQVGAEPRTWARAGQCGRGEVSSAPHPCP